MSQVSVILFWVQAGAALWLALILQLVYRRIYHEKFLHYWSLAFVAMGAPMAMQLAILPSNPPPELFTSPLLFYLGMIQLPMIVLAGLSVTSPNLDRRAQAIAFFGILTAILIVHFVIDWTVQASQSLQNAHRFERLFSISTASLWFCGVFWRKHFLARSAGGKIIILFTALRSIHYLILAVTVIGLPIYPGSYSFLGSLIAAILPFGIASGMILLAAEAMTRTNNRLQESESRYRLLAENTSDVIWLYDLTKRQLTYVSPAVQRQRGYTPQEVMDRTNSSPELPPDGFARLQTQMAGRIAALEKGDESARFQLQSMELSRKDGTLQASEVASKLITDDQGRVTQIQGVTRDISERRLLEFQLMQAQKMESVGRLAGGIAHDFNNILQILKGYSALVIAELEPDSTTHKDMEEVVLAVERAQNLVRQLLIFSRREKPRKKHFALSSLVSGMVGMLSRLIGEDIQLTTQMEDDGRCIFADAGQVEQALLNLCINAKDAMPSGGAILISTRHAQIDTNAIPKIPGSREGSFIELTVTDSGVGMSQETLNHIFEPFFTTKDVGHGTGLGLSMVYGIVKEHDGFACVESERGAGSSFKLYFPESAELPEQDIPGQPSSRAAGGTETVLLVEDERMVRVVASRFLTEAGYRVIEASDGAQAVEMFTANKDAIRIVIMDLIMPNLGGKSAGEMIRAISNTIPLLFITGYDFGQLNATSLPETNCEWISKPFSRNELLLKTRQMLDHQTH
jgi:PAS domain S-box-containing protein